MRICLMMVDLPDSPAPGYRWLATGYAGMQVGKGESIRTEQQYLDRPVVLLLVCPDDLVYGGAVLPLLLHLRADVLRVHAAHGADGTSRRTTAAAAAVSKRCAKLVSLSVCVSGLFASAYQVKRRIVSCNNAVFMLESGCSPTSGQPARCWTPARSTEDTHAHRDRNTP